MQAQNTKKKKRKRKNSVPKSPAISTYIPDSSPQQPEPKIPIEEPKKSIQDPIGPTQNHETQRDSTNLSFIASIWSCLAEELTGEDLQNQEVKEKRINNFLSVPRKLEGFMYFGYLICLDSFLHLFTILPLRILYAMFIIIRRFFGR